MSCSPRCFPILSAEICSSFQICSSILFFVFHKVWGFWDAVSNFWSSLHYYRYVIKIQLNASKIQPVQCKLRGKHWKCFHLKLFNSVKSYCCCCWFFFFFHSNKFCVCVCDRSITVSNPLHIMEWCTQLGFINVTLPP